MTDNQTILKERFGIDPDVLSLIEKQEETLHGRWTIWLSTIDRLDIPC